MQVNLAEFAQRLESDIPVSKFMGLKPIEVSNQRVILGAPLMANINYNQTAFGGSIYSVAVLSCWALVGEIVKQAGFHVGYVVIQDGEMQYKAPVDADFTAEAKWPARAERERFILTLGRRGLARVTLESIVRTEEKICGKLTGRFAAQISR